MKDLILYFLLLVILFEGLVLFLTNRPKAEARVLAEKTALVLTPSPLPTPTPISTPKLTKRPTPTPVPGPTYSSQEINGFIDSFSGQFGVDPNFLRHIALCESDFDPFAVQASYVGLFQFGPVTWQNLRQVMNKDSNIDLRNNARESVETAAYALSNGKRSLWPKCGK